MAKGKKKNVVPRAPKPVDLETFPFHQLTSANLAAGLSSFPLSPTGIAGRSLAAADAWSFFRVLSFRFRLRRPTLATGLQVACYIGSVPDTVPATTAQAVEVLNSTIMSANDTVPQEWSVVPALELAGPFDWYKSIPGAADVTEEEPGLLIVTGAVAADPFLLETFGVFQFKVATSTGNTPEELRLVAELRAIALARAQARARASAIRLLAPLSLK